MKAERLRVDAVSVSRRNDEPRVTLDCGEVVTMMANRGCFDRNMLS